MIRRNQFRFWRFLAFSNDSLPKRNHQIWMVFYKRNNNADIIRDLCALKCYGWQIRNFRSFSLVFWIITNKNKSLRMEFDDVLHYEHWLIVEKSLHNFIFGGTDLMCVKRCFFFWWEFEFHHILSSNKRVSREML